jgi:hypothetical protein
MLKDIFKGIILIFPSVFLWYKWTTIPYLWKGFTIILLAWIGGYIYKEIESNDLPRKP